MDINYQDIDDAITHFENKQFSDESEKEFIGQFPEILSYLTSNQFSILSESEYMILLFDAMVVLKALMNKLGGIHRVDNNTIEIFETKNWDLFETFSNMSYQEKAYKLFNNENKEVVDFITSGMENEDIDLEYFEEISTPAKEIILISIKTIFDCYSAIEK